MLRIAHGEQEGIEILHLKGRLVLGREDLMLRDEIGKAIAAGNTRLVVNLDAVSDIDTAGLGTLLFAQAELAKVGGGFALARLRRTHMEVLVLAKMERSFEVFREQQDAINSFFLGCRVHPFNILELLETARQEESPPLALCAIRP